VGLGVIVPAILLIFLRRKIWAVATAGALIAITFLVVRLNVVIPGLAIPELPGLEAAFTGPGLTTHYIPSINEWLVFVWAVGLAALIFLIGRRILPIIHTER